MAVRGGARSRTAPAESPSRRSRGRCRHVRGTVPRTRRLGPCPGSDPGRGSSGTEDDLEGGAAAGDRAEREGAADRGGALAHVAQALAGAVTGRVEAVAVVVERDEAVDAATGDRQRRLARACVAACVGEPFLDDAEDLDLLVGRELHARVDLELDLEPAVGREEVDVTAQRGIERGAAR